MELNLEEEMLGRKSAEATLFKKQNPKKFTNTEIVHHFGYYIGNFPSLSIKKQKLLQKF